MERSGQMVVGVKLWQYYLGLLPRALRPGAPARASGTGSELPETVMTHVLISAMGGVAGLAVEWLVGKARKPKT
jgi:hypothetical protein